MLQRVMIDGIKLPRLYIAENQQDAKLAREKGIPFVRWTQGQDALIKILLRPVLERMFPFIKWDAILGERQKFKTMVNICSSDNEAPEQDELAEQAGGLDDSVDACEVGIDDEPTVETDDTLTIKTEDDTIVEYAGAADGERLFNGSVPMVEWKRLNIETYVGDLNSYVNIDVLQRLRLMPAFIGDILECVKLNLTSGIYWREGYNKKRGLPIGRFDASRQLPNLIILDVSGSIPRGISATMISLIDTLRSQLTADLIITGSNSRFYAMGESLPNPQRIRNMFGLGNECEEFFSILERNIKGNHYGHVFSFGDYDTPEYFGYTKQHCPGLGGTTVEFVHHYHTGAGLEKGKAGKTGYAKWCHMLSKKPREEYDTSWCKAIATKEKRCR